MPLLVAALSLTIAAAVVTSAATSTPGSRTTATATPSPTSSPTPMPSSSPSAAVSPGGGTPSASGSVTPSPAASATAQQTPSATATSTAVTGAALYVSNPGYLSVLEFPVHIHGDVAPKHIAGGATGLQDPLGIYVDVFKEIFVANSLYGTIVEFAAGKIGNATPLTTISGSSTGLQFPYGVALDGDGNIYATNQEPAKSVTEYMAGTNGNVAPIATISGNQTGLEAPAGIVIDGSGVIYVANSTPPSITEYAAGSTGDVAPTVTIAGSDTGLSGPAGITLDAAGNIYVTNFGNDSVAEFAASATADAAPTATISGPSTGLSGPVAVAVDTSGNIYVANSNSNVVTEYAAGSSGDAAPIVTIAGAATQLFNPASLAIALTFPTKPIKQTPTPTPTPRSIFSISPNSIVFPTVGVGATPAAQTFTITNPGAKAAGDVNVSDLGTSAYKVKGKGAFTLGHGKSKTVEILFAPPSGLSFSGTISVTSKSPKSLGIVSVTGAGQGGILTVLQTSLQFGKEPVGGASPPQAVTIENSGVGGLHVSAALQTEGQGTGVFAVGAGKGSYTLAAGKKITVNVKFTPKAKKNYLEALEVKSDDPNHPEDFVLLSGTGS